MPTNVTRRVTFPVHRVEPASKLLPVVRTHEAVARLIGFPIEACVDYHGEVVAGVVVNPLVQAVHLAFSQHRPLVLTPDAIWVTILQGLAAHVAKAPEAVRARLGVTHEGKTLIEIEREDLVPGPEAPWAEIVDDLVAATRARLGSAAVCDELLRGFSTTGKAERLAQAVAVLDVFQPFCDYIVLCICGIPSITLEGTTDDWSDLRGRIDRLEGFGVEFWTRHLRPICDQFVRASRGDVDLEHWRAIYKLDHAYGVQQVNGWLARLFPYLDGHAHNPTLDLDPDDGAASLKAPGFFPTLTTQSFPLGLSRVTVHQEWKDPSRQSRTVELLGGLLGVVQDSSLALRPKLGWAVRVPRLEALLERMAQEATACGTNARPLEASSASRSCWGSDGPEARELRAIVERFPGGATTHGGAGTRLLGAAEMVESVMVKVVPGSAAIGVDDPDPDDPDTDVLVQIREFAVLPDGRSLAIDEHHLVNPNPPPFTLHPLRKSVVAYRRDRLTAPGECRVVATNFEDALEAILDHACPVLPDLGPAFVPLGTWPDAPAAPPPGT